ncbi:MULTISPECIES: peptidoglycan-binding protein [Bacillales]|jgi:3D (Asp-Asp-Asp) domain-containing protein|uniref:peptidoglycan-binding protein n=1 Tax=Bacillales TaxID=1385 RepID=UPI000BF5C5C5|nr:MULTISPECIES: peptidoglycan-binding protein [Bacillaceae]MCA0991992.1 peptidoglycan-binding protein [Pseudalkalibacillus hwajinpoensis]PFG14384.1 3D (Asp-Asp-Asp) domain-containing protein [Bacillus sp. es.036]QHA93020.1 peptidoglycan-binding protein [Bacillus sp. N1-1]
MVARKNIVRNVVTSTALAGMMFASPVVSEAALGDQTLSYGEKHGDVVELQDVLSAKGYFNYDESTGYYGSITEGAVKQFQKEHGLAVDGIAGPNTFSAMQSVNNGQAMRTLVQGDRGHQVQALQEELGGYYNYTVDGIYGPITEQAVRAFQADNGLSVDGIAGKNTWSVLNGGSAPAPKAPAKKEAANKEAVQTSTTSNSTPAKESNTESKSSQASGQEIQMEATAYTAFCTGCSGVTATGIDLRANPNQKVIAVDPDVIPLGSKVHVEGYGEAVAGDTGGAIQGNRVDLFMADRQDALDFGRKTVTVTVLD